MSYDGGVVDKRKVTLDCVSRKAGPHSAAINVSVEFPTENLSKQGNGDFKIIFF